MNHPNPAHAPVLVAGTVALDTVDTPFGNARDALGGAAYAAAAVALFTEARLLGVVGEDFPEAHLNALRERGVDLTGVTRLPGKSFRWQAYYGYDLAGPRTVATQLHVQADWRPPVSPDLADVAFVYLAAMSPDRQLAVLDAVHRPAFVLADTMGYWLAEDPDGVRKVVTRADAIITSDAEARQLTGTASVIAAARHLYGMGPRVVIIRKGAYGAIMLTADGYFSTPAFPVEEMRDPTGMGDTFAGGFIGYLAYGGAPAPEALRKAMAYGAVLASYASEDFGLNRILTLTPGEMALRYAELRQIASFAE